MQIFNHKKSVFQASLHDVFVLVAMMLMYPGSIWLLEESRTRNRSTILEWSYVGFRTAIPTLVFNFVQLLFMLVFVLF